MKVPGPAEPAVACDLPPRLTRAELAALWRVSVRTIERREAAGLCPAPIRIGGRVLYPRDEVLACETARRGAVGA